MEPSRAQKKGNVQAVTDGYSCQRSRRHWVDIERLQIEGSRKQKTMEAALVGTLGLHNERRGSSYVVKVTCT